MNLKQLILACGCLICLGLCACSDRLEEVSSGAQGDGNVRIEFCAGEMPVIRTRSGDANDATIESVNLFVFDKKNGSKIFKKMFQHFDKESTVMSMYLSSGDYVLHAVCNWENPEQLNEQIQTLDDLENLTLDLRNADDAFMGKYVMYGKVEATVNDSMQSIQIDVTRLASFHDFTINFIPDKSGEKFHLTEAWMCQIPRGSWVVPRAESPSYDIANTNEWVYQADTDNMKKRYFMRTRLSLEEISFFDDVNFNWTYHASFSLLENQRGGIPVEKETNGQEYNETYWKGSKALAATGQLEQLDAMRQFNKRRYAPDCSTYLTLHGLYQNEMGTSQVTYYVYLGEDSYKDYNVKRNYYYKTTINIKTINQVDTRVESKSLADITFVTSDEVLDAHCNVLKGVLFSPDPWEIWVENPDKTPWLELSGSPVYRNVQLGQTDFDKEVYPSYKIEGDRSTLRTIYIHVDEYIPDITDPNKNQHSQVRIGTIAFRKKNSSHIQRVTVKQYPAQLAVLHIKRRPLIEAEVCDTFYIERILEEKYLPWGLESYWSFITDEMISTGQWDGLTNTRNLYQVALYGDKWGVKPAYPVEQFPDGIPAQTALGYVINKNRDRDGNGKIDSDEIRWYFPARKEVQALYEPLVSGQLFLQNSNSIFHTSTPSSADPGGVTVGFSYYVKMSNGKYGIGQRNRAYNVVALRRKHSEWNGPTADDAEFTVAVETNWIDEEVIMPK